MKYGLTLLPVLLCLTLCRTVFPQDSHVELSYSKDLDRTVVRSDILYVVNTPEQFIQVQFTGWYPKQGRPTRPPDRLYFEFYSYAASPLYQQDATHRLAVKADEQIIDFGLMDYSQANESGRGTFAGKKEKLAVRAALPSVALVAAKKAPDLTLELMSVTNLSLRDLAQLASAREVLMKIGSTVFALTAMQRSILREFAASVTPDNADAAAMKTRSVINVSADVPSDVNNASLDATLKFLKAEIDRNGTANEVVVPQKMEPLDFKSCQIRYRRVPLFRTSPVSNTLVYAILEYQMNLADLNPEAVSMANFAEYSTIFLVTRDHEKKIRVITRANDNGFAGRIQAEKLYSSVGFSVSNGNSGAQVKVALVHAINLCHARP